MTEWNYSAIPSKKMKAKILERDNRTCQYCGHYIKENYYIFEHIVPRKLGGPTEEFNLVIACYSCNCTKSRNVWIPHNFDSITEGMDEWREKVIELSKQYFPLKYRPNPPEKPVFRTPDEWRDFYRQLYINNAKWLREHGQDHQKSRN